MAIPRGESQLTIHERKCRRKMDGVVRAQRVSFREPAGELDDLRLRLHVVDLVENARERGACSRSLPLRESSSAARPRERRSGLDS
jgi:hypothetical protein